MDNARAGETPIAKALAMLDLFASVGVSVFDLTFTNIKEDAPGRQEVRALPGDTTSA